MVGRRLSDGVVVREPASERYRAWAGCAALVLAAATCPSHDSFAAYLAAMAQHPSGLLGGLSALVESVQIAVSAESSPWLLLRVGRFRGELYLGLFGTWFPTKLDLPLPSLPLLSEPWELVCSGGRSPHEAFALLCVAGFVLWQIYPRAMYRHAVCSLRAVEEGRMWVVLTANLSHASPLHLLHNLLSIMHFGPCAAALIGGRGRGPGGEGGSPSPAWGRPHAPPALTPLPPAPLARRCRIVRVSLGCERLVQLLALACVARCGRAAPRAPGPAEP